MYLVSMFVLQIRSDILPLCRMKCHSWWERSTRTSLWRAGKSRWRRHFIKRSSRRWWGTRVQTCSTGSRETCMRPWRSAITHPSWWATCTSGSLNERSKGAAHSPAARRKTTPCEFNTTWVWLLHPNTPSPFLWLFSCISVHLGSGDGRRGRGPGWRQQRHQQTGQLCRNQTTPAVREAGVQTPSPGLHPERTATW